MVSYIFLNFFEISDDGNSLTGTFEIKKDFWVFRDHFPGFPIFPGALMIEAMAQHSVALMMQKKEKNSSVLPTLIQVDRAKFLEPVVPDCVLDIVIKKEMEMYPNFKFLGEIHVDGKKVASARLTMSFKDMGTGPGLDFMDFFLKGAS